MNTTGLQFLSNEAKRLTHWAFNLSTNMIRTCLKIQYKVAVLPVYFMYGGLKYIYQSYTLDSEMEPSQEPSSEAVVSAMIRLRSSVVSSMNGVSSSRLDTETNSTASNNGSVNEQTGNFLGVNEFSGSDLMWDIPVIYEKAKYFKDCLKEKEGTKLTVARKALREHPIKSKIPKTRLEFTQILTKARNGQECSVSPVAKNRDGSQFRNAVDSIVGEIISSERMEINSEQSKELDLNASNQRCQRPETQCNCKTFSPQCMTMHRDMVRLGRTLGKTHETCNTILELLSHLNVHLETIISMREQLGRLEFQVEEGNRLYKEVEQERSMLREKLVALEKLISEEERYFSDISSYESGFYESENFVQN